MFDGCSNLKSVDLRNFNTEETTDMRFMFKGCTSLTSVDLSSFNTNNCNYFNNMFQDITSINVKVTKSKAGNLIEALNEAGNVKVDIVE